jgi:hypothetical protein
LCVHSKNILCRIFCHKRKGKEKDILKKKEEEKERKKKKKEKKKKKRWKGRSR